MANSLEVRNPYLDPSLVRFVWSLPDKYLYKKNHDKFIHVEFVFHSSLKTYDSIQVFHKNIPNDYEVFAIIGKIYFEKNIHECVSKRDQIVNDLKRVLENSFVYNL